MSLRRQDAWSQEDDDILATIIIQHIKNGGTQISAFEKAAVKLERTPAACGFRWNSTVRKKYAAQVKEARIQRKKRPLESKLTFKIGDLKDDEK